MVAVFVFIASIGCETPRKARRVGIVTSRGQSNLEDLALMVGMRALAADTT